MTQVLVVDDSLSVRKALEIILKPHAYVVRMADSGESAMKALDEAPADLVIADVLMPGMSGFDLCGHIKSDPRRKHVPVVLISGIVSDEESRRAAEVGAAGLVRKPFKAEDLLPVVAKAVRDAEPILAAPAAPAAPTDTALDLGGLDTLAAELLAKQGVLSVAVVDARGEALLWRGDVQSDADVLGQYLRFFAATSGVFGSRLEQEWQGTLMEFSGRALLLSPLEGGHTLALVLRDAGAASMAKFVVRSQRSRFDQLLAAH